MYKYAVVGKGMIGSAAARYLSQWSEGVVLVGPDEPKGEWAAHMEGACLLNLAQKLRVARFLLNPTIHSQTKWLSFQST